MKPSDVKLFARSWVPLTATFGRVERELAAAFIVTTCVHHGDTWKPVTWKQIAETMRPLMRVDRNWKEIAGNPFVKPDVHDLIAKGFARWIGEKDADGDQGVEFTEEGMAVLRKEVAREDAKVSASG